MKQIFKLISSALCLVVAISALNGCKTATKALLPKISGKAGEVIVVIDKNNWEGALGNECREVLAGDCPFLAQSEPLYSLVNVAPGAFADLFKVHRNILIFNIDPQLDSASVQFRQDIWAEPQCVIQISAPESSAALETFRQNSARVLGAIETAERDRVINNSIRYEERSLSSAVKERFGGSPHFPTGYKIKKLTDDFVWIAYETQYTIQGIFVYRYPAIIAEPLTLENIVEQRNAILENNVPGMFDNTYMTTGTVFPPYVEYLQFRGRPFAQTRGYWEVKNDFMGGPFVSHSFYSADGKDIIVLDAFVYAPKYDKRQYLRQVESILYSWSWVKEVKK